MHLFVSVAEGGEGGKCRVQGSLPLYIPPGQVLTTCSLESWVACGCRPSGAWNCPEGSALPGPHPAWVENIRSTLVPLVPSLQGSPQVAVRLRAFLGQGDVGVGLEHCDLDPKSWPPAGLARAGVRLSLPGEREGESSSPLPITSVRNSLTLLRVTVTEHSGIKRGGYQPFPGLSPSLQTWNLISFLL